MPSKPKTTAKPLPVRLRDIRGVHEISFNLLPGVNLFLGANGAGKTTSIAAVEAAAGGSNGLLVPRAGTSRGYVEGLGATLTIGKRTTSTGEPSVELADAGRFGDLVRPSYDSRSARAKARIKALLHFRPLAVDEETLLRLCGGDLDVAASVQRLHPSWEDLSVLDLADAIVRAANSLGNEKEKVRDGKAGEIRVLAEQLDAAGGEILAGEELDVAALAEAVSDRRLELAKMEVQAKGRAKLLAQQAEIRASLGDRPDLEDLEWKEGEAREEVEELTAKLAEAKGRLAECESVLRSARERAAAYDQNSSILSQPIDGPTLEEVDLAAQRLVELEQDLDAARETGRVQALQDSLRQAKTEREDLDVAALHYRDIAKGVTAESAQILREQELPDLVLEDGELALVLPGGETRPLDELSFGEQVKVAARVALTAHRDADLPVVVALAPEFWAALDHAAKQELVEIAAAEGLYVLAEEPTEGELQVQHLDQENASEMLGAA